jgi:hypothetical protein
LPIEAYYEDVGKEIAIEHSDAAAKLIEGLEKTGVCSHRARRESFCKPVDTNAKVA